MKRFTYALLALWVASAVVGDAAIASAQSRGERRSNSPSSSRGPSDSRGSAPRQSAPSVSRQPSAPSRSAPSRSAPTVQQSAPSSNRSSSPSARSSTPSTPRIQSPSPSRSAPSSPRVQSPSSPSTPRVQSPPSSSRPQITPSTPSTSRGPSASDNRPTIRGNNPEPSSPRISGNSPAENRGPSNRPQIASDPSRSPIAQPSRPESPRNEPSRPQINNRDDANRGPGNRPESPRNEPSRPQINNRDDANRGPGNRPESPRNEPSRPQINNRDDANRGPGNRPESPRNEPSRPQINNRDDSNRGPGNRPESPRNEPSRPSINNRDNPLPGDTNRTPGNRGETRRPDTNPNLPGVNDRDRNSPRNDPRLPGNRDGNRGPLGRPDRDDPSSRPVRENERGEREVRWREGRDGRDMPVIPLDRTLRTNRDRSLPGIDRNGDRDRIRRPSELSLTDRRRSLSDRMVQANNITIINNNNINIRNRNVWINTHHAGFWPVWYDLNFGYHRFWHHGHWFNPFWSPMPYCGWWWNRYPVMIGFGITDYSLCYTGYAFGYRPYFNPFWSSTLLYQTGPIYSQPIVYQTVQAAQPLPEQSDPGLAAFERARGQFRDGLYEPALLSTDEALRHLPNDLEIHEFRSLVMFAMGNYNEAAAGLYAVLEVSPGWNWDTLKSVYPSVAAYTRHLRALEDYRSANPDQMAARFVLAYHYRAMDHRSEAIQQLQIVSRQNPNDRLVARLLRDLDPDLEFPQFAEVPPPPAVESEVAVAQLIGTWNASRDDGSSFQMMLNEDGSFQWSFKKDDMQSNLKGAYVMQEKGVMALEMEDGAVLLAQIVPQDDGFEFYMLGDDAGLPPLKFRR